MKQTKEHIINRIIDYRVNPSWLGSTADQERIDWRKELKKMNKKELIAELREHQETELDELYCN